MNAGQLLNLRHQIDAALDGMKKELEAQLVQISSLSGPLIKRSTPTVRKKGPLAGRKVAPKYRNPTNTKETGELSMIEGISAVTLGTHEMPRAVRFYRALGFEVLHGGEDSSFTSFRAGASYLNLIAQPEPPRVCRRLQLLRRWSHDEQDN